MECHRERPQDEHRLYIRCSCSSLMPTSACVCVGSIWPSYTEKLIIAVAIMSYGFLDWMSEETQSHKTTRRHDCEFSCPPSCHCEAPSSLFSRFSSGLMKIEVFYGR